MTELGRIYWSRQLLKLSYTITVLWLGWSILTPLLRGTAAPTEIAAGVSGAADVLTSLFQPVLEAVIAPAVALLLLGLTAAVITSLDVRRRDPVRRFTRQQRREGMARADGRCEFGVGARRCSRPAEHGDHFYPWSKGGRPRCRTSLRRAAGATVPRGRGSRHRACSDGSNDGAWLTVSTRRRFWSASAEASKQGKSKTAARLLDRHGLLWCPQRFASLHCVTGSHNRPYRSAGGILSPCTHL